MKKFVLALLAAGLLSGSAFAGDLYWDADAVATGNDVSTGAGLGGTGAWSTAQSRWWDGASSSDVGWIEGSSAIFWGPTAGTVTLSGGRTANGLTFKTDGYTVTASTLTLTTPAPIFVASGVKATIASTLLGTAGYSLSGGGTLFLNQPTNSNTITGAVSVTGGSTLDLAIGGQIGGTGASSGNVTLNNGTLRNDDITATATAFLTANRSIIIGASGGTLELSASTAILAYSGTINGSSTNTLTKAGPGTLRVSSASGNVTTSKLVVTGGLYQTNLELSLGVAPGAFTADAITLNGGGISANGSISILANRGITLGAAGGTLNVISAITAGSVITGAGSLTKTGTSTTNALDLTAANTFNGGFNLSQGLVRAGNNAALGTAGKPVTISNATILSGNSGTARSLNYAYTINGDFTLGQASGGTAVVTMAGTMDLAGATRKITLANPADTITATIDNGGLLVDAGAGVLTINNAANTYIGGTTIRSGTVIWSASGSLGAGGTVTLNDASTGTSNTALLRNTNGTLARDILVSNNGTGTVTIGNDTGTSSSATIYSGLVTLDRSATLKSGADPLTPVRFSNVISGAGGVDITGAGTIEFSANNSYSGGTKISAGKLSLGIGSVNGNVTGNILNNAALLANRSNDFTIAGNITGTGSFSQIGSGKVTLGGTNGYGGGTTVSSGKLEGTSDSLQGFVTNNAEVIFNQAVTGTYAGSMSGTGALTKEGVGKLILSGANSYGGATTINNGTLQMDGVNTGTGLITVNTGGTLGGNGTIAAPVLLNGGTLAAGASIGSLSTGSLTLTTGSYDFEFSGGGGLAIDNAVAQGADVWNVAGTLTVLNAVTLVGTDLGTLALAPATKFTVFSYTTAATPAASDFRFGNAPTDGGSVTLDGVTFVINYYDATPGVNGGSGASYVTLTAVPENSSIVVMGLGGLFTIGAVWLGKRYGLMLKV